MLEKSDEKATDDHAVGDGVDVFEKARGHGPVVNARDRLLLHVALEVPHIPLVKGEVDRLVRAGRFLHLIRDGDNLIDKALHVDTACKEAGEVAIAFPVVGVAREQINVLVRRFENRSFPVAKSWHVARRRSARHQGGVRVNESDCVGDRCGLLRVVLRAQVPKLPRAVHLIAKAPHVGSDWRAPSIGDPSVGQCCTGVNDAVLDKVEGLLKPARSKVDGQHRLCAGAIEPRHELVKTHLVCLDRVPRKVEAPGAEFTRADAVLPAIARHEVATGVANDGNAKLRHEVENVVTEAVSVGGGMSWLVDAGIHTASQVLNKRAKEVTINGADAGVGGDGKMSGNHGRSFGRGGDATARL